MPEVSSSPPVAVTVHVTVSELGEVVASSIQIDGVRTSAERAAVREGAEKWTFRPARHDGCWVPGMFETRIELGESPERERDERG